MNMNWRNPDLTLQYQTGKTGCYLQVNEDIDSETVQLKDIHSGALYTFPVSQLDDLTRRGLIRPVAHSVDALMDDREAELQTQDQVEFQRRLAYVLGAFVEGRPLKGSELLPYIDLKAIELNDENPPSRMSVYRWIKQYKDQGEPALHTKRSVRGNHTPRLSQEHESLLTDMINSDKESNLTALHREYSLSAIQRGITPISYEAFRKRIKKSSDHRG